MKTDNVPFVLITVWSFPHSWIIVFVLCFFSSSCVPYVASFSELSFFDPLRYSLTFIYHRVCIKSNTTGATCETGTTEFTIVFLGVRVARFLVFCVMFCRSLFVLFLLAIFGARVAEWARSLDLTAHTSLSPIRRGFVPSFVNYKKGALDSQPQVIKLFTSCLPRADGSLRVLRLPPPLKLVAMI
jgi:hypothetical protein